MEHTFRNHAYHTASITSTTSHHFHQTTSLLLPHPPLPSLPPLPPPCQHLSSPTHLINLLHTPECASRDWNPARIVRLQWLTVSLNFASITDRCLGRYSFLRLFLPSRLAHFLIHLYTLNPSHSRGHIYRVRFKVGLALTTTSPAITPINLRSR